MYINKKSPIPVYFQLRNIIINKIEQGEYELGSIIPSERDLAEQLSISRMTVRQALSQLVNEGVLYREKGRGTFVSKIKFEQKNIMSFSDTVRKRGMEPKTEVLNFGLTEAGKFICEILDLNENEKVYNIKRLRLADSNPIAIEEAFIPQKYCPDMKMEDLYKSLYKLLKQKYSYTISFIDNDIQAALPTKEEKSLLNISSIIPILNISGVNYTEEGLKLYFERSVYRSDEYKYNVRVHVNKD